MLESKWGLRFVALILALFMFLSVNDVFENIEVFNENGGDDETELIQGMPVEVLYDEEDYYVSGVPSQVNVQLSGSTSNIARLQTTRDFDVLLDLRDRGPGEHEVHYTIDGMPENVTAEVIPETSVVSVQELVSQTFTVQAEVDESRFGPGHQLESVDVAPETVTIHGGENEMNRIQYVRAALSDNSRITEDRVEEAEVAVFDFQFNRLDVRTEPSNVRVEINVNELSKTVPVNYEVTGMVDSDHELVDVVLNHDYIDVFGSQEVLDNIDSANVEIDVDGLENSVTRDVELDLPEGVTKTEPAVLEVELTIEEND
ncbi:CdaR family protein [Lacicoccus alkaliphilus]|uniref:YbbR domain-containing protein n=1 Tax=Lacicoccus alkaliphilus DSM 16010 TaxID=1123231 RepID=A0A1M7KQ82_9BACL|nr:CdaR family protein [Salinicoccus alkaliphilus]SHM67659.1 YbbR domain-containing protein [Salinicoccus alkaliphilus DSM 16010]